MLTNAPRMQLTICNIQVNGHGGIPYYQWWVLIQNRYFLFFPSEHISSWALLEANRFLSHKAGKEPGKQLKHWFDFLNFLSFLRDGQEHAAYLEN